MKSNYNFLRSFLKQLFLLFAKNVRSVAKIAEDVSLQVSGPVQRRGVRVCMYMYVHGTSALCLVTSPFLYLFPSVLPFFLPVAFPSVSFLSVSSSLCLLQYVSYQFSISPSASLLLHLSLYFPCCLSPFVTLHLHLRLSLSLYLLLSIAISTFASPSSSSPSCLFYSSLPSPLYSSSPSPLP